MESAGLLTEEKDSHENESDEEESDEEPELTDDQLSSLQSATSLYPRDYSAHQNLIIALRRAGRFLELREAREAFHVQYPMTAPLWLQWTGDERRQAASLEQRNAVTKLFHRACDDYLSVPLWTSRCEHARECFERGDLNVTQVRETYENALEAAGLHVTAGGSIWSAYRAFEEEQPDARERLAKLFARQLRVPLQENEQVLDEFVRWDVEEGSGGQSAAAIAESHAAAQQALEERRPFELAVTKALQNADPSGTGGAGGEATGSSPDVLAAWNRYLAFEESKNDPSRVLVLFERALSQCCLQPTLWSAAAAFAEGTLKDSKLTSRLYERAVRNCPQSSPLWSAYARAIERKSIADGSADTAAPVTVLVHRALATSELRVSPTACLEVLLCELDAKRRLLLATKTNVEVFTAGMHDAFEAAVRFLSESFPDGADCGAVLAIERYAASLYSRAFLDLDRARTWRERSLKRHGLEASLWHEFITMERNARELERCRSLFKRALHVLRGEPTALRDACIAWLTFEREEGVLADWDAANKRTANILSRLDGAVAASSHVAAMTSTAPRRNGAAAEKKQRKKRERAADGQRRKKKGNDMPATENRVKSKVKDRKHSRDESGVAEPHTVFVLNLPYSATEADVAAFFETKVGAVKEVRLVTKGGRPAGYGYVEFEANPKSGASASKDDEMLVAALKLNGTRMGDRVLTVQRSLPKGVRYKGNATGLEAECVAARSAAKAVEGFHPFTVFLANLHPKEALDGSSPEGPHPGLRSALDECGIIVKVRILTKDDGSSKCCALVQFETESSVAKALKLSGRRSSAQGGSRKIKVARSKFAAVLPPKQREDGGSGDAVIKSGQHDSHGISESVEAKNPKKRKNPYLSTFLVPRSVKRDPSTGNTKRTKR